MPEEDKAKQKAMKKNKQKKETTHMDRGQR